MSRVRIIWEEPVTPDGGWCFFLSDDDDPVATVTVIRCLPGAAHPMWERPAAVDAPPAPVPGIHLGGVAGRTGFRAAVQTYLDRLNADEEQER